MTENVRKTISFGEPELTLGTGHKAGIIAEVGQAHDGSLGIAHSFIDRAAEAGADIIKFQTHIAGVESTPAEPFRVKFSYEDDTRYEYWQRMEFSPDQWDGLMKHTREKGLLFLSSPFSVEAVELLDRLGIAAWKVGSGEVNNQELFKALGRTGKPILISSGMSDYNEIEQVVQAVRGHSNPYMLLQCTSMYPTPLEKVGLNVLKYLRKYDVPVGLSDHSGQIYPGLAAMACGADLLEVHVTFDHRMFGVDNPVSLTFEELEVLSSARDAFHLMRQSDVDKDRMAEELSGMRALFNKSVTLRIDLPAGATLEREHLTAKKPGTGIPVSEMDKLVGRTLKRDIKLTELLDWEDFE